MKKKRKIQKRKIRSACSFLISTVLVLPFLLSFGGCSAAPGEEKPGISDTERSEEETVPSGQETNEISSLSESSEEESTTQEENILETNANPVTILPFRDITAAELVSNLGRGWNLGNTFDSAIFGGDPKTAETGWGNPLTTGEMFRALHEKGFDSVRIPVTWQGFTSAAPDYRIDPDYMKRVRTVVDLALENDMYVILNTHHEEWVSLYKSTYEEESTHLTRLWIQIAEEFKGYDEHLIFEDLNEPRRRNTSIEWTGGDAESRELLNRLNEDFVRTIRASGGNNDRRLLMLPGYAASSSDHVLKAISLPDDPMIAVSVHAYIPYDFALNKKGTSVWSETDSSDTIEIDHLMKTLDSEFLKKGIPVIIGEVGAMGKENEDIRVKWAAYYYGKADEYGIPMFWWDNGLFSGDGETFGLFDRRNLSWPYPDLTRTILDSEE